MALTGAQRQRRSRAHARGDHSLCDSSRCDGTSPGQVVTSHVPPRLGGRGRRLWADLKGDELAPGRRELLAEACRLVDRLERLDAILSGVDRDWCRLAVELDDLDLGGITVTVTLDKVLSEARQQQMALKQVLSELRQSAAPGSAAPRGARTVAPVDVEGAGDRSGVTDLTARIARRRASPAG